MLPAADDYTGIAGIFNKRCGLLLLDMGEGAGINKLEISLQGTSPILLP